MHPLFQKAGGLTEHIIGAAIEEHKDKGPGLVESIYEWCLLRELELRRLSTESQRMVRIMRLLDVPTGLLINFNTSKLTDGVSRLILPGANL